MLERFEKIYLWLDNDQSGRDAAEKFANKLGLKRCVVVKPDPAIQPSPPKDANDALRSQGGMRCAIHPLIATHHLIPPLTHTHYRTPSYTHSHAPFHLFDTHSHTPYHSPLTVYLFDNINS